MFCIRMDLIKFILVSLFIYPNASFGIKFVDEFKASKNYHNKNYYDAQRKYEEILINNPDDIETLYNIANVFYEKKNTIKQKIITKKFHP